MAKPKYDVETTPTADRVLKTLDSTTRKKYDAAVDEIRHRGCKAGGTRMRNTAGGDARICNRRFYRTWRMHLLFGEDDYILISFIGQHERENNIHEVAAELIPELAAIGRKTEDKPKCCDDLGEPPVAQDLVELLGTIT